MTFKDELIKNKHDNIILSNYNRTIELKELLRNLFSSNIETFYLEYYKEHDLDIIKALGFDCEIITSYDRINAYESEKITKLIIYVT